MNVALRTPVAVRVDRPIDIRADINARMPADNQVSSIRGRVLPFQSELGHSTGNAQIAKTAVAVVDVDGLLVNRNQTGLGSMGENPVALFREKLDAIASDDAIQAVILRINSPGGGVTACDIMRQDLIRFRQQTGLPVVACVLDTGAGGAYYVATACDSIISHPTSIVGGIGVILNLYNLEDLMLQFNVMPETIRAGDQSDAGSPVRPMSDEERKMLQGIADSFHQRFRDAVLESRRDYRGDSEIDLQGAVFTGSSALEKGLIDGVGYLDNAVAEALAMAGSDGPAELRLYRRNNDRARTPYDVTPNIPLQNSVFPLRIPGIERSELPTFLYIWQLEPTLEKSGG